MKDDELINLNKERRLNQKIELLEDREVMDTDLWPSIKQQILLDKNKTRRGQDDWQKNEMSLDRSRLDRHDASKSQYYTPRWIPWAIAASLLVSVGSVTFSWRALNQAESIYAELDQVKESGSENSGFEVLTSNVQDSKGIANQVKLMEQEFTLAKASLMSRISMNQKRIDDTLLKDINDRLLEIELATKSLKDAIGKNPEEESLHSLLKMTYQQELTVLTQLAKLDSSI